ncbi:HAD-IIA family hydrolase [Chloroflexus sp.]|uniref:HAD-IIA family hydrolase n=1 Tax=Chloroflexus sp. TaxID=1904827 RepID=UPI00298EDBC1|nr:HAD-IIA family hydrolase [Chloroflexus sp.]MCS6887340.1 HAD-IIA family hydrolase [Chloroflexus sp.]MDW8403747.1 HAD-IIA family hydrolase [Chloroflexus sp.]
MVSFNSIRAVLFDMDGVLYRGQTPLPGVTDLWQFLRDRQIAFACATNNASMTPQQYAAKLAAMGLVLPPERVITSAQATARYLRDHYPPGTRVFVVGMQGLREALFADGHFIEDDHAPELVVQGADFTLTYERLKRATLHIRRGARFVSTNPDRTFPSEEGLIPGAGAIAAAISAATDVTPLVIGKPAPTMFLIGAAMLGATPAQTLVVGDRLDTDIAGAIAAGMPSVLVLTGVSTAEEAMAGPIRPNLIVADLPDLLARWQAVV